MFLSQLTTKSKYHAFFQTTRNNIKNNINITWEGVERKPAWSYVIFLPYSLNLLIFPLVFHSTSSCIHSTFSFHSLKIATRSNQFPNPGGAGGGTQVCKSGQGPTRARTGRGCAVGISFSEGERGLPPLPPTMQSPAFYSVFCVSPFFGSCGSRGVHMAQHRAQKASKLGQHSPKMGQHSSKMGQHSSKMGQHSPKMGQHSPKMGQHSPKLGQPSP